MPSMSVTLTQKRKLLSSIAVPAIAAVEWCLSAKLTGLRARPNSVSHTRL